MEFLCGDTYLGTKSELRTIGKGSRRIVIYTSGIHLEEEALVG